MVPAQRPLMGAAKFSDNGAFNEAKHHKHSRTTPPLPDRLLIGGASATGFVLLCLILLWFFGVRPLLARASRASSQTRTQGVDVKAQAQKGDIIQVQTLDPSFLPVTDRHGKSRRLVVVGDVHGCRAELEALLHKIVFEPSHDHLILAGDMINKGPDSHGVIAMMRSLGGTGVRGNHEDKVLRAHASLNQTPSGTKNKNAVEALASELSKEDVKWLSQCPLILSLGAIPGLPFANTVVVHAGLVPNVPLEVQNPFDVMNMRSIIKETMKASESKDVGTQWWRVWNESQGRLPKGKRSLVVYGHNSKEGLVEADYSFGLDTGCVKGGMLSALVIGGQDKHSKTDLRIESVRCGTHL